MSDQVEVLDLGLAEVSLVEVESGQEVEELDLVVEVSLEVESDQGAGPDRAGRVVEELSRGWKLYGKVIRPARVKIAK